MLSKCLLQLPMSLWRASLFVWLLRPLTLSIPDNMCTAILWFEVGNSFGKLGFNVRKKPLRLNKMRDPIPSINCLPILFLNGVLGLQEFVILSQAFSVPYLTIPTWVASRSVRTIHSAAFVFSAARVSQSLVMKPLYFWKKRKEREVEK